MAYIRRVVKDGETIMNADLYNNLQDGIDAAILGLNSATMRYNEETHRLVVGVKEQEVEQEDNNMSNEFDDDDIITPEDAENIFDEAEAEANGN